MGHQIVTPVAMLSPVRKIKLKKNNEQLYF